MNPTDLSGPDTLNPVFGVGGSISFGPSGPAGTVTGSVTNSPTVAAQANLLNNVPLLVIIIAVVVLATR